MPAIEERELSEHDFIGHVFMKASPILTWRPTKVQRITPAQIGERTSDSASHRFSRAPTRRMMSWPVIARVRRTPTRALRALLTLVAFSLLCGSALTLCVYVLLGDSSPFAGDGATACHASVVPTRAAVAHVADARLDTLLTASATPVAPLAVAAATPAPARRTAARAQHASGHANAQHGHAAPAGSAHSARAAAHAAAGTGSPNRRTT
jgi:hypothetical protein